MNTVEDNGREEMTRVFDMTRRETLGVGGCRRHAAGRSFVGDDSDNKNGDWRLPLSLSAGLSKSVTTGPLKVG